MKTIALLATLLAIKPLTVVDGNGGAATLLDLDAVLDQSIDGVEDAPEYVTPPEGRYMLECKDAKIEEYKVTDKETKEEVKRVRIKIVYGVVQTHELADAADEPVPANSMFTEQFMTNPQGLSYFKRQAKNILGEETIKGAKIGDILKELPQNHQFNAEVRIKSTKGSGENAGKTYQNVQVRIKGGDPLANAAAS